MPDMTPMDMQKKGSATSGFHRIAEVALPILVVFRNEYIPYIVLVREPYYTTIVKTCTTL